MIKYQDAVQHILEYKLQLRTKKVSWEEAQGHVVACDYFAKHNVPPFSNSAMDGYAVKQESLQQATQEKPVILQVGKDITAGQPSKPTEPTEAMPIMTGAVMPEGYDSVVPIEKTKQITNDTVAFYDTVTLHENVRFAGSDFEKGCKLLTKGQKITPLLAMTAIAGGIRKIEVFCKLRIALLATGDEIISINEQKELGYGQIYDSNAPSVQAWLESHGCEVISNERIKDDPTLLEQKIQNLLRQNIDIILTIGAVSKGVKDFIPSVIEKQGATCLFHRVSIRPGKPIYVASLNKKENKSVLFVGLPGNPISSLLGVRFFIYPFIRQCYSMKQEKPFSAILCNNFTRKANQLRYFLKARHHITEQGEVQVELLEGQESYKTYPLKEASCWVVVPEESLEIKKGQIAACYLV